MSAWPEAVWIVKQLKKYFEVDNIMRSVTEDLKGTRTNINELIGKLNTDQAKLEGLEKNLKLKIYTIATRSKNSNNTEPEGVAQSDYNRDTIWFILSDEPGAGTQG